MEQAKNTMTSKVTTIKASDTMTTAYKLMREKHIRHLPVVDERNMAIGIISDRDVQRAMTIKKINKFQQSAHLDETSLVEDFMSWPVYTVSEDTSVAKVAEEMLAQNVSAFIVQDMKGHMKGIITTNDILKLFLKLDAKNNEIGQKSMSYYFLGPEVY